jgi:hypothetical protein
MGIMTETVTDTTATATATATATMAVVTMVVARSLTAGDPTTGTGTTARGPTTTTTVARLHLTRTVLALPKATSLFALTSLLALAKLLQASVTVTEEVSAEIGAATLAEVVGSHLLIHRSALWYLVSPATFPKNA